MADLLTLDQTDLDRLSRLLNDYEAGRLFAPPPSQEYKFGVPIESYVGLVVDDLPASAGEPTSGTVQVYGQDNDTGMMATDPSFTITAWSLWATDIPMCSWVYLIRDPFSGSYFAWPTGTAGCGSGAPAWYCLGNPPGSGSGSGSGSSSGSGSGSGAPCGPCANTESEYCLMVGDVGTEACEAGPCSVFNGPFTLYASSPCWYSTDYFEWPCQPLEGDSTQFNWTMVYYQAGEYTESSPAVWVISLWFGAGGYISYVLDADEWDCESPVQFPVNPGAVFGSGVCTGSGQQIDISNLCCWPPSVWVYPGGSCSGSGESGPSGSGSGAWYCLGQGSGSGESGPSGSGSGAWYCLDGPLDGPGAWYCLEGPTSGSGSGSVACEGDCIVFWLWALPGDDPTSVDWSFQTDSGGIPSGTITQSGTGGKYTLVGTDHDSFGYNVWQGVVSCDLSSLGGATWLVLDNAPTTGSDIIGWDVSNGPADGPGDVRLCGSGYGRSCSPALERWTAAVLRTGTPSGTSTATRRTS